MIDLIALANAPIPDRVLPTAEEIDAARVAGANARADSDYPSNPHGKASPERREAWQAGWDEADAVARAAANSPRPAHREIESI